MHKRKLWKNENAMIVSKFSIFATEINNSKFVLHIYILYDLFIINRVYQIRQTKNFSKWI